ncbi:DUF4386 domain-containing protein [Aquimarina sp. 2201CG5-10]|uniref:DUF4386 domain-containing protein n=1 Tax=Aquimarina callyspongiae TaxID=3098150 RepID=UPI002AB3F21F|nr:DUF4386 domain-containing protein [Aquimarina sp. 2201CG5-10]MDY8135637.1 DUF4386 domain-containing protein [Aquimarina sp. 2201CG5-10]
MYSIKKTGKIVGLLFILMFLTGATGTSLRGLSSSLIESQNLMNLIYENISQMKIAILLDFVASIIGVGISVILFPILKQQNKAVAYWYFGLWVVGFAITIVSNITHLSLISLSQEFVTTTILDTAYFNTLGVLKIEEYYWAHFFILIIFSIGAFIFYYSLFKTKLIPRFLSIWFMISVSIVFIVTWLQIFGYSVSFGFYAQNGLHLITLAFWLIIKGFNFSKTTPALE